MRAMILALAMAVSTGAAQADVLSLWGAKAFNGDIATTVAQYKTLSPLAEKHGAQVEIFVDDTYGQQQVTFGMRFASLTDWGTFKDAFGADPEVAAWMAKYQPDYNRHFTQSMLWANVSSPAAGVDVVDGKNVFWAASFLATSPSNADRTIREFTKMAKYIESLGSTAHIYTNGVDDNIWFTFAFDSFSEGSQLFTTLATDPTWQKITGDFGAKNLARASSQSWVTRGQ